MLPSSLRIVRLVLWFQAAALAAVAFAGAALALVAAPSLWQPDRGDDSGFAGLGSFLVEAGACIAAVGAAAALLLVLTVRRVRDGGGRPAVVALVAGASVEVAAGLFSVWSAATAVSIDAAVLLTLLAAPCLVAAGSCLRPSSRGWMRRSWRGARVVS